ncbi:YheC/YheD family protein [Bacillaceae bacterium Marseille-Q3522]|nr:YheC/YheD family protein [Bacillaceae bacterium Marseille-Q3522]
MLQSCRSIILKTSENLPDNVIHLSSNLQQYWKICSDRVTIKLGVNTGEYYFKQFSDKKNQLHVPVSLWNHWNLPQKEIKLMGCYKKQTATIILGPIIGLLTEISKQADFGTLQTFSEEVQHAISSVGGIFYMFSPQHLTDTAISGFYFYEEQWQKMILPLPSVVYNRIRSRSFEKSSSFQYFKEKLDFKKIPFFNDHYLEKHTVHEVLLSAKQLHRYLPETKIASDTNITTLLEKYHRLFFKPVCGSQGRHIIRLTAEENLFKAEISSGNEITNSFANIDSFLDWFSGLQQKREYLVQQAVPFLHDNHRPLDFRLLCHKTSDNSWRVISSIARISGKEQFVANLARGGEMHKTKDLLAGFFELPKASELHLQMKQLAVEIAEILNNHEDGLIGELGIDFGIDTKGNIWIIEVNAKPSKMNDSKELQMIRPSAKALIEYCIFLTFIDYS